MSSIIDNKGGFTGLVIAFKDIREKVEHERVVKEFENRRMAALPEGQEMQPAKDHHGLGQMLNAI